MHLVYGYEICIVDLFVIRNSYFQNLYFHGFHISHLFSNLCATKYSVIFPSKVNWPTLFRSSCFKAQTKPHKISGKNSKGIDEDIENMHKDMLSISNILMRKIE
ncbi:hypothetical protein V6Z12_D09G115700 [Gossypium hirsutum]